MSELRNKIRQMVRDEFIYRLLYEAEGEAKKDSYEMFWDSFGNQSKEEYFRHVFDILQDKKADGSLKEDDYLQAYEDVFGASQAESAKEQVEDGAIPHNVDLDDMAENISRASWIFSKIGEGNFLKSLKKFADSEDIVVKGAEKVEGTKEYQSAGEEGFALDKIAKFLGQTKQNAALIVDKASARVGMTYLRQKKDQARTGKKPDMPPNPYLAAFLQGFLDRYSFTDFMQREFKMSDAEAAEQYKKLLQFKNLVVQDEKTIDEDFLKALLGFAKNRGLMEYLIEGGEESLEAMLSDIVKSFLDHVSEDLKDYKSEHRSADERVILHILLTAIEHSEIQDADPEDRMAVRSAVEKFADILKEELHDQSLFVVSMGLADDEDRKKLLQHLGVLAKAGRPAGSTKAAMAAKRAAAEEPDED